MDTWQGDEKLPGACSPQVMSVANSSLQHTFRKRQTLHPEERKCSTLRICYSQQCKREAGGDMNMGSIPLRVTRVLAFRHHFLCFAATTKVPRQLSFTEVHEMLLLQSSCKTWGGGKGVEFSLQGSTCLRHIRVTESGPKNKPPLFHLPEPGAKLLLCCRSQKACCRVVPQLTHWHIEP